MEARLSCAWAFDLQSGVSSRSSTDRHTERVFARQVEYQESGCLPGRGRIPGIRTLTGAGFQCLPALEFSGKVRLDRCQSLLDLRNL